ncbi:hypothetical protein BDV59DRAFT_180502 [Aspergillus ambiguus]|uniref:uncharacterized protein n=1 Tax=Aspergillus ambiguus TaxID=176160 RepID=UPI003CCCBA4D
MRFFQHSYWRRVWIFQEVALARHLLFTTRNGWLPWEDFDLTTCFAQEFIERLREGRVQKPIWLDRHAWEQMAWAFRDLQTFEQIRRARRKEHLHTNTGDMPETFGGWEISLIAGQRLVATDHKDYVYGLLGLSKLPIIPEYSVTKTVWDVYREYAEKWLEHYRQIPRSSSGFSPLAFLSMAGIGFSSSKADESSLSDYSSWAPNFPQLGKYTKTTKPGGLADSNITIFDDTTYAYVKNQSLFVSGFRIGLVTSTPVFGELGDAYYLPIVNYIADFLRRRNKYISGITPLQAFVQLIRPHDWSTRIDRTAILFSLAFLKWAHRARPLIPLEVEISPNWFENWFLHFFWEGADLDLEALGLKGTLHNIFQEDPDGLLSNFKETLNGCFNDFQGSWRFFEINDAYLGIIPASVRPGDCVYNLDGCGTPVVLRPNIDHFVFVGTATVAGLMHGEAAELVTLGGLELEKCEIR